MRSLLFPFLLLLSLNTIAQNKFIGEWYDTKVTAEQDILSDRLRIHKTTQFEVCVNQLALECKNVFKKDTLYLYVIGSDQGRGFAGPTFYPPKKGSLFAKCYITDKTIHVIYTQKMFYDNIDRLNLLSILYEHN